MTSRPSMQERAELPMRYAFITLIPLLIFIVYTIMINTLANNYVPFAVDLPDKDNLLVPREAASRLKMLGMLLLTSLITIAIILKFAFDVRTYFSRPLVTRCI